MINTPSLGVVSLTASQSPITLTLQEAQVSAGQELHGIVEIGYQGRYDSLVINSQIERSNDVFSYVGLNGKKVKHPYARYSIFKSELGGRSKIEFVAVTSHVPEGADTPTVAKFRVSLIQEHKEVATDIKHVSITRSA
ncbi:MAG: hypothetical protein ABI361_00270 [Nitrososphaera sp.]